MVRFLGQLGICILTITFVFSAGYPAIGDDSGWVREKTRYTVLAYRSVDDLSRFVDRIDYGEKPGFSLMRLAFGPKDREIIRLAAQKTDAVYERARDILGMNRTLRPVTIMIYPNVHELKAAYETVSGQEGGARAWYVFDKNIVAVSVDDLNEGILAHELAHSIIDHYLMMRPPAPTAEILARFVDKNLKTARIESAGPPRETIGYTGKRP